MASVIGQGRSPRYPRLSLNEALQHARKLYDEAHRSVLSTDTAYRVLGYSGKTGASATVLGALRQYGLVDGLRGDVSISDLALKIFEPSSAEEHADALAEAAASPEAFKSIAGQFPTGIPRSDEPLRAFLIRTLAFSKAGAEECIKSFRESLAQAQVRVRLQADATPDLEHENDVPSNELDGSRSQVARTEINEASKARGQNAGEFTRIPLTRNCVAELRLEGEITHEAIDRLVTYIQFMREIWAE